MLWIVECVETRIETEDGKADLKLGPWVSSPPLLCWALGLSGLRCEILHEVLRARTGLEVEAVGLRRLRGGKDLTAICACTQTCATNVVTEKRPSCGCKNCHLPTVEDAKGGHSRTVPTRTPMKRFGASNLS